MALEVVEEAIKHDRAGKNEARRGKTSSQSPNQAKKSPENRATKASVVNREKAAVLKPQDTIYSKGTFTDAEFKAALKAIEDELKAQGKPLYQMTAEMAREKSRREVMRGE